MANDCSTTYKIVGETTELQAIYQAVEYFITLEEAIARVKQVTGQQHITTEEQMLQATEDFVEPEYHTPIYILRKFNIDE